MHSKDVQLQYYPPSAYLRQSAEGALKGASTILFGFVIATAAHLNRFPQQSLANQRLRTGLRFTPESALCLRGIGGGVLRRAPAAVLDGSGTRTLPPPRAADGGTGMGSKREKSSTKLGIPPFSCSAGVQESGSPASTVRLNFPRLVGPMAHCAPPRIPARDPLGLSRRGLARAPLRPRDRSSAADPPEVPI